MPVLRSTTCATVTAARSCHFFSPFTGAEDLAYRTRTPPHTPPRGTRHVLPFTPPPGSRHVSISTPPQTPPRAPRTPQHKAAPAWSPPQKSKKASTPLRDPALRGYHHRQLATPPCTPPRKTPPRRMVHNPYRLPGTPDASKSPLVKRSPINGLRASPKPRTPTRTRTILQRQNTPQTPALHPGTPQLSIAVTPQQKPVAILHGEFTTSPDHDVPVPLNSDSTFLESTSSIAELSTATQMLQFTATEHLPPSLQQPSVQQFDGSTPGFESSAPVMHEQQFHRTPPTENQVCVLASKHRQWLCSSVSLATLFSALSATLVVAPFVGVVLYCCSHSQFCSAVRTLCFFPQLRFQQQQYAVPTPDLITTPQHFAPQVGDQRLNVQFTMPVQTPQYGQVLVPLSSFQQLFKCLLAPPIIYAICLLCCQVI